MWQAFIVGVEKDFDSFFVKTPKYIEEYRRDCNVEFNLFLLVQAIIYAYPYV